MGEITRTECEEKSGKEKRMKEIEIETPCGIVKGIREDQINKFLGIRYGTAGRWEYPREVTSWGKVFTLHCILGRHLCRRERFYTRRPEKREF